MKVKNTATKTTTGSKGVVYPANDARSIAENERFGATYYTITKDSVLLSIVEKLNMTFPDVEFSKTDADKIVSAVRQGFQEALQTAKNVITDEKGIDSVTVWTPIGTSGKVSLQKSRNMKDPSILLKIQERKALLEKEGLTEEEIASDEQIAQLAEEFASSSITTAENVVVKFKQQKVLDPKEKSAE